jgi:hypothetical protein
MLFRGLITWKAAYQDIITTSITKAELLRLAHISKELIATKRFLNDL